MTVVKSALSDLALFGAAPAFEEPLHVGRPNQGDRQRLFERMSEMLDRNWLTNDGPFVQEFEQRLADRLQVGNVVVMANATVGLEIAIRALGMTGEVIVPAFTFVATAHALQWQEITPVFVDVDPVTHTVNPARVEELITPRTSGILGVHLWGRPCNVVALAEIAHRRGLRLLYDAAHAFGATTLGVPIGNFGDAEVFSFHATKVLNSFEGGAVVTNDDDLAERMRLMRNFGFAGIDTVVHLGTNGKMSEASAAMGLTSLEAFEHFVAVNAANDADYRAKFDGLPGVRLVEQGAGRGEERNYHYVVAEIDELAAGLTRDELWQVLTTENVFARRYFHPGAHRMEPYKSFMPSAHLLLPHTEALSKRVLVFPTGMAIGPAEISTVADIVRVAVENAPAVRARLGRSDTPAGA
ncbi:MAG TPA: DegT/DnrJ/EryC1/StrS family aminotransferase [Acidimicrobiia bacterium]|nr:DegT/DnrJ/EryC1/StrS family aminotransferase [Acidimicrobiia bacterium]